MEQVLNVHEALCECLDDIGAFMGTTEQALQSINRYMNYVERSNTRLSVELRGIEAEKKEIETKYSDLYVATEAVAQTNRHLNAKNTTLEAHNKYQFGVIVEQREELDLHRENTELEPYEEAAKVLYRHLKRTGKESTSLRIGDVIFDVFVEAKKVKVAAA